LNIFNLIAIQSESAAKDHVGKKALSSVLLLLLLLVLLLLLLNVLLP
jgi:hypothetical protein